jgi:hypothetical protein
MKKLDFTAESTTGMMKAVISNCGNLIFTNYQGTALYRFITYIVDLCQASLQSVNEERPLTWQSYLSIGNSICNNYIIISFKSVYLYF